MKTSSKLQVALGVLFSAFFWQVVCSSAANFGGRVVGVSDGDTITILTSTKEQFKVRLFGIDSPESNQSFGSKAKQFTSEQCFGKSVTVQDQGKDRYGRTIGVVLLPGGTNLNLSIVRNGSAWWYRAYAAKETDYESAETESLHRTLRNKNNCESTTLNLLILWMLKSHASSVYLKRRFLTS